MAERNIEITDYNVLAAFTEMYYDGLITKNHIGDETAISIDGEKMFIYPVKYRGKLYALPSAIIEDKKLPIKVTDSKKFAYRSTVYHLVTRYAAAEIEPEKTKEFNEVLDIIGDFHHSNQPHNVLYKIAFIMLYFRKGFCRVATTASFGKNSFPGIIKILMQDLAVINPRSAAAFEHRLINDTIVLDELTNLAAAQGEFMEQILLQIGDWSTSYEKGTRGSSKYGGKDEYNISKLSVMAIFNIYDYYLKTKSKGEKYFDKVFQLAVHTRFCPFVFNGIMDASQFKAIAKPKDVAIKHYAEIKDMIKNIKYYAKNLEQHTKPYKLNKDYRLAEHGRFDKTFSLICTGINLYASTEKEYQDMVEELYQCHLQYDIMMSVDELEEVELDEPIKQVQKVQEE